MANFVQSLLSVLVLLMTYSAQEETDKIALLCDKLYANSKLKTIMPNYVYMKAGQTKRQAVTTLSMHDNHRPTIPSITLSNAILDMIWKETRAEGINYYTFLALIKVESNFEATTVHHNDNGSTDYGLVQMNSINIIRYTKDLGGEKLDIFNPNHNIRLGIEELLECRSYWKDTYAGENLEKAMLLAYNRGRVGSRRWIDNKGMIDSSYTKKVMKYKHYFAQEARKHVGQTFSGPSG